MIALMASGVDQSGGQTLRRSGESPAATVDSSPAGLSSESRSAACGFDEAVFEVPAAERTAVTVEACPVCKGTTAVPRFTIEGVPYRVVVCESCGLGQLSPRPTPEAISGFYPSEYYGTSGAKFKSLVETLVRIVGGRHVRS